MPLPSSFSNNTTPTGPQLDNNFAAVGALAVIPCTAAGTNTITLTQNANTPTIAAYANYLRLAAVAAGSNTTAATAQLGALAALPIYRDSPAGPVALTGNEIIANCAFTLIYDSALNAGNGGFHLISTPISLARAGGTVSGDTTFTGNVTASGTASTLTAAGIFVGATINGTVGSISNSLALATLSATAGLFGTSLATLAHLLSASTSVAFTMVPAQTAQDQNITLTGVQTGDHVFIGATVLPTNASYSGYVPAAGTISVRVVNAGSASLAPFTLTGRVSAMGIK